MAAEEFPLEEIEDPYEKAALGPPLSGRTIVITRAEDRSDRLARLLQDLGARVVSLPTIRFAPPHDPAPLHEAISRLPSYRWLLFTSATAVRFFWQAALARGVDAKAFAGLRIAVVGPATAAAVCDLGLDVTRVAIAGTASSLARMLVGPEAKEALGHSDPCLLPQADIARADLPTALRAAGVPVTSVTAYRTVAEEAEKALPFFQLLEGDERIDAIAFASPSALRSFLAMTHPHGEHAIREKPICVFSIGPTTSQAIRERGLRVAREASPHTAEALVTAIVDELTPEPKGATRKEPTQEGNSSVGGETGTAEPSDD